MTSSYPGQALLGQRSSLFICLEQQQPQLMMHILGAETTSLGVVQSWINGSRQARRLDFSPASDQLEVGWARFSADRSLTGLVLFQIVESGTGLVKSEVSLFDSPLASRFTTLFSKFEGPAMAIANPGRESFLLDATLRTEEGIVAQNSLLIESHEQLATFIDEAFFGVAIPDEATLEIETPGPTRRHDFLEDGERFGYINQPSRVPARPEWDAWPDQPPTAVLRYRLGESGQFELANETLINVDSPIQIAIDGGSSSDDRGLISYAFSVQQDLTSGGAILSGPGEESQRLLEIASGTSGTITVTMVVTDQGGQSDPTQVVFQVTSGE